MKGKRRGLKAQTIWNEKRLEDVTNALIEEGLFKPEDVPVVPRLKIPSSPSGVDRSFDPVFYKDQSAPWDQIFTDEAKENAKWLSQSYPGFLQDGALSELLRRRPENLRESIARDLIEGSVLEDFPTKFRITVFLISRGIKEEGDPTKKPLFPEYSWRDFLHYQPKADRLIRSAKEHYFLRNKGIDPKKSVSTWERFDLAWQKLSVKQRSALEIHIMSEDPLSLEMGAKRLRISKTSFRDRIASAIKIMEKALPELLATKPRKNPPKSRKPKKVGSLFIPRKDAPSQTDLNAWLNETCQEPNALDWEIIFRKDSSRKNHF